MNTNGTYIIKNLRILKLKGNPDKDYSHIQSGQQLHFNIKHGYSEIFNL